jgi:hypothetical protein
MVELWKMDIKQLGDSLVIMGRYYFEHYEEFDLVSRYDFGVKVLWGRARIKKRENKRKRWKEYTITPLSDRVVLKLWEYLYQDPVYEWDELVSEKRIHIYEYTRDCKWHKLSEKVYEE